jgi:drug/metabolite transporter (DMT)-like permease
MGGLSSRRLGSLLAVTLGQGVGLVMALLLVLVSGEARPPLEGLAWGVAAGLVGMAGLVAFYRVLGGGPMSLAAPLVAVIGAGVPALVGLATGDRPGALQLTGMALGLAAVVIVSAAGEPTADEVGEGDEAALARAAAPALTRRALPEVVVAGLGFAGFYLCIHAATTSAPGTTWWPLLAARAATVAAAALGVAMLRPRPRDLGGAVPFFVGSGLGDLGGNGFFLLAAGQGLFSVAVILSSLYPVTTVMLATLLLRERLHRWHLVGVVLALVGVILIAL